MVIGMIMIFVMRFLLSAVMLMASILWVPAGMVRVFWLAGGCPLPVLVVVSIVLPAPAVIVMAVITGCSGHASTIPLLSLVVRIVPRYFLLFRQMQAVRCVMMGLLYLKTDLQINTGFPPYENRRTCI